MQKSQKKTLTKNVKSINKKDKCSSIIKSYKKISDKMHKKRKEFGNTQQKINPLQRKVRQKKISDKLHELRKEKGILQQQLYQITQNMKKYDCWKDL